MIASLPHSGSETSRAAARIAQSKSGADRKLITAFIAGRGPKGATDDDIAIFLPSINANAIRARRGECWAHGLITDSLGERRATRTGCKAQVYHITRRGLEKLNLTGWSVES